MQTPPCHLSCKDPALGGWVIGLSLLMLVLAICHDSVNPWLGYDRLAVLDGQVWRLLTCHFVHLNLNHFLLDDAGFLLVWWIFRDVLTRRLLWWWLAISTPVCGLVLLADSSLYGYVGLSGILHGWLVIALVAGWRTSPLLHGGMLAALAAKLLYEQTPAYDIGYLAHLIHGNVYPLAHLEGALAGLCIALVLCVCRKPAPPAQQP